MNENAIGVLAFRAMLALLELAEVELVSWLWLRVTALIGPRGRLVIDRTVRVVCEIDVSLSWLWLRVTALIGPRGRLVIDRTVRVVCEIDVSLSWL